MKASVARLARISLVLCLLLFAGCDSGYDCALENVAYNRVKFYTIDSNGAETEYALPEALTVSMMVNGRDSIVVNHITNAKEMKLPMSYTAACDTVIMNFFGRYSDTLYIGHSNIPIYQSMECGVIMHHRLTTAASTNVIIDSLAVNETSVNFDNNENIKLYFTE